MATVAVTGEVEPRAGLRASLLLALVLGGAAAAAATGWAVARSPVLEDAEASAVLRALEVASLVWVGTTIWWRRPANQLGKLMVGVGAVYASSSLNASGRSLPYTLGMVAFEAFVVALPYLYLCFPQGHLETRPERMLFVGFALAAGTLLAAILLVSEQLPAAGPSADCGSRCPDNALRVVAAPAAIGHALVVAFQTVTSIALVGIAALIVRKALAPSRLRRRAFGPVAVVLVALIAGYVLYRAVSAAHPGTATGFRVFTGAVALAAPMSILLGQVWGSVSVATSLGRLAIRAGAGPLGPARMQGLIGEALGDPALTLGLWTPERGGYVDVDGAPLELPTDRKVRGVTFVTRARRPVAVLLHAPDLYVDPEVIDALAATSLLLLENSRLIEELRASRSRIVATAERERLRLERDLHDGAQQRLMGIQVKLSLAREQAAEGELSRELEEIGADAAAAVAELRALAHGIYPTLLRERGLGDALRSVALTAPLTVRVVDAGIGRCSGAVEAAVYFCCLEAIQNAAKHAGPSAHVTVTFARRADEVEFVVADDGPGLEPGRAGEGLGLVGMRDRIGAVGGELEIVSTAGEGTSVRGRVPAGAAQAPGDDPEPVGR